VVRDGESARYLGARIGNHTNELEPWLPIVERIELILDHCAEGHPTLEAKRHQIQLTIGAITQYLTQANGMPESTTKQLVKIQKQFLDAPVNRETMSARIEEGGKKILDLYARNDAIKIIQLKNYLEQDPHLRPTWAYIADALLAKKRNKSCNIWDDACIMPYLQQWDPSP
jgi:hypothetical protein